MAKKRDLCYLERRAISLKYPTIPPLSMIKYTLPPLNEPRHLHTDIIDEYARLNAFYNIEKFPQELAMCIVVPSYNNNQNFRVQLNLNSIFMQNYSNYKVVIIDDASTDNTALLIRRYLDYYNISSRKAELIVNKINKKALQNIYQATLNNCIEQQIVVLIDGDDEFLGFNVLKVVNAQYQSKKLGVFYSNYVSFNYKEKYAEAAITSDYTQEEKEKQLYRQSEQRFSHLITFKRDLMEEIRR